MNISFYCSGLDKIHQERYISKIRLLGIDPYTINSEDCSVDIADFPKILYPDIVMYLVHTTSAFTINEMKAYKSLEAYNQAVCGWVKKICVKCFDSHILILGKVMHSQRLSEKLLSPWIICKKEGNIINAHCDCIAGLGEVCTHVAAVLFSIDEAIRKQEEVTRTEIKAYWMPPSNKPIEPKRVREMDLSNPKRKYLEETPLRLREKEKVDICSLSDEEKNKLLSDLNKSRGSVLHLITQPFSDHIKQVRDERKNFDIMSIYRKENQNKSLIELQKLGTQINFTIELKDCEDIERETKKQYKCKQWFVYRRGRVTASKFKRVCRTSVEKPSVSLIKEICYPTSHRYKIKALDYGCIHEKDAVKDFLLAMKKNHLNLKYENMGLCINPKYPYFGASPDGMIYCDCCGTALVEIKCPYCARHSGVMELSDKKSFMETVEGKIAIKEDHEYYFQIQMQLALTEREFCYIVVWSKKDFIYSKVPFNQAFWLKKSKEAKEFFQKVILPEALGKHFTKQEDIPDKLQTTGGDEWEVFSDIDVYEEVITVCETIEVSQIEEPPRNIPPQPCSSKPVLFCLCQKEDDHRTPMIACDAQNCPIEWYHLGCVGLIEIPDGIWICDECKK